MIIYYSELFAEKVKALPLEVRRALKKKLELLSENPRHPSLRTKKIRGQDNIFEANITMDISYDLAIHRRRFLLRNIVEHDKTLKNP